MNDITFKIPSEDDILDVIWEAFTNRLGEDIPIIRANQAGARPPDKKKSKKKKSQLYLTIDLITGFVSEGRDDEIIEAIDGDEDNVNKTTKSQPEMTLSVNAYRAGAKDLMNKLQKLLNTTTMKEEIKSLARAKSFDLTIIEALSSQDLTEIVQSDYEERSQMDVRMRTVSAITEKIGRIKTVIYDGETKNVAGETVEDSTDTVTIP